MCFSLYHIFKICETNIHHNNDDINDELIKKVMSYTKSKYSNDCFNKIIIRNILKGFYFTKIEESFFLIFNGDPYLAIIESNNFQTTYNTIIIRKDSEKILFHSICSNHSEDYKCDNIDLDNITKINLSYGFVTEFLENLVYLFKTNGEKNFADIVSLKLYLESVMIKKNR